MRIILKAALATAAFAAVHSALASQPVKHAVSRRIGEERAKAGYRVFFVAQSLLGFAALAAYAARLPDRTVYRATGSTAMLLRLGQCAGLLHLAAGLREIGFMRWSGLRNLEAWWSGRRVPRAPVAQGPEMMDDGFLSSNGPFRWSRHPLNFAGIPIFWCTPHMTTRRLGFNLVSTLYFVLGSAHEEARLRAGYGHQYLAYVRRNVPFFLPLRLASDNKSAGARSAPNEIGVRRS